MSWKIKGSVLSISTAQRKVCFRGTKFFVNVPLLLTDFFDTRLLFL